MKKGFTLIELLAVIAILSIISVIAYPRVIDLIGSSRLTAYNVAKKNIIDSAKLKYLADVNSALVTEYTVNDLIESGYIDNGTKNPLTSEEYSTNTRVLITKEDGNIKYEYVEGNTLFDLVSNKGENNFVYNINNELVYKGINAQNYVIFNGEAYRIIKIDKYRHTYLIKQTDEKIEKKDIDNYINTYYNDNYDELIRRKLYGKLEILSSELFKQTLLNDNSYINTDNGIWIRDNDYKVMYINNEVVDENIANMTIIVKLNNSVIVGGGEGTQLNPYIIEN